MFYNDRIFKCVQVVPIDGRVFSRLMQNGTTDQLCRVLFGVKAIYTVSGKNVTP